MAFFIARGLLDLGIRGDLRWAPASFTALAASIAAVRAGAGHLLTAVQRENAYAAPTRQRLIEALTLIDQRLTERSASSGLRPDLEIPGLGRGAGDFSPGPGDESGHPGLTSTVSAGVD